MIKIIILFIFNKFANAFFIFFREYTKIPSFPRSRESERVRTETYIPSFPRRRESRTQNLKKPFYPISFRTDRPRFPPARE
ncbi:PilS cassette [Neisseria meningitidis]|nr:PilS cassette [Neisseria meningitidis]